MKTIGMIGGMSWESSLEYYRIINETVKARLGGLHSAKSLLFSFDFEEIETLQMAGDWVKATELMVQAARQLERGGADFIIICTNTMHKMAEDVQAAISIPLLHIADATATAIQAQNLHTIGLLGTNFTMEEEFYKGRLEQKFGLEVIVPERPERQIVHDIIYDELCLGITKADSRARYRQIMADLTAAGAEGIILGCTEIGLLVNQEDSPVPLFDTTVIHAETAVTFALEA
ncbi:MAG: aspartate/glutamate racemase family protein [Ardenticatenaceae bacterium]|nr:aspartate/glutamate racemase family protein [Ardenticatenaceae bacterium]